MKKTGKSKDTGIKGFGFGDALFAMKDLQGDYLGLNQKPIEPAIKPPNIIKEAQKKPIAKKQIPNKNNPKSQSLGVKNPNPPNNQNYFKVNPGKEFNVNQRIQLKQLKIHQLIKNVFQLSSSSQPTKQQYFVFCDGVPAQQIIPTPQITFNFNCQDLKQGSLGNCYFICALGSLAHCPQILKQRIPTFQSIEPAKDKSFQVNMFQSGKLVNMVVDNLFPMIYCKPAGNDITPMILEKAYAQLYGNFDVINLGHSCDAMRDLTGAPTQYIDLKSQTNLIKQIQQAIQNKWGLVIATKKEVQSEMISAKHSYNILDFEVIQGEIYLKLRDPRGWTKAAFKIPAKLEAESQIMRGNGVFWVGYNDLKNNFEVITTCMINPYYSYFFRTYSHKEINHKPISLLLSLKMPLKGTFTIHQKHKKYFDEKYTYDILRLLIAKVEISQKQLSIVQIIDAKFNSSQVCVINCELQPGDYILIGDMGSKNKVTNTNNQKFTLSIYCNHSDIKISQCDGSIKLSDYASRYIRDNKHLFSQNITQKKLQRYYGTFLGYVCIYYENNGEKHVMEQIDYDSENITITEKKVQLKPSENYIIMNPIGSSNNCSHKCSIKTKTYYK